MNKIIIFILIILSFSACRKEGCIDKDAINYDPKAKVSNYTCLFNSAGGIYWNSTSQDNMTTNGVTSLTCIFDHDTIFKNKEINTFIPKVDPDCTDNELIKFERLNYWDPFKVGLMLLDQDNDTIYASAISLLPGCNAYKLNIN